MLTQKQSGRKCTTKKAPHTRCLSCSAIQLPAAISLWKSSGFLSFMVCGSRRQYFVFAPHQALSLRLTRPSLFPSVPFPCFDWCSHLAWGSTRLPNKKDTVSGVSFIRQLPILPGRFQPSTFGVCELNFRVRHGNGCILTAIATISEGCSFKTI